MEDTLTAPTKEQKVDLPDGYTKVRKYYDIHDGKVVKSTTEGDLTQHSFSFKTREKAYPADDLFDGELITLVFDINYLNHIDSILRQFNLREDVFYFYQQCQDVIAVPEYHVDEKGNGKMAFQSYFHNIPHSLCSINYTALVVATLHVEEAKGDAPRNYHLVNYIHVNKFDFKPDPTKDILEPAFFWNMLRISERTIKGEQIYRRQKIFNTVFWVLHDLTYEHNVKYAYANMGRENDSIAKSLRQNSKRWNIAFERLPFKMYSLINRVTGSKKAAKRLVNITDDPDRLRDMYQKVHSKMKNYLFYHYLTEDHFMDFIQKMTGYSKTSGVYCLEDESGNMTACTVAVNWGDYLTFMIKNPTGVFKVIQKFEIMKKFLYFMLSWGEPAEFRQLVKGLSHKYLKEQGVEVTIQPAFKGDPHYEVKKSLLDDDYAYFVITHDQQKMDEFKKHASDKDGNVMLFLDQPIP